MEICDNKRRTCFGETFIINRSNFICLKKVEINMWYVVLFYKAAEKLNVNCYRNYIDKRHDSEVKHSVLFSFYVFCSIRSNKPFGNCRSAASSSVISVKFGLAIFVYSFCTIFQRTVQLFCSMFTINDRACFNC